MSSAVCSRVNVYPVYPRTNTKIEQEFLLPVKNISNTLNFREVAQNSIKFTMHFLRKVYKVEEIVTYLLQC